jgi:spermidine synthase
MFRRGKDAMASKCYSVVTYLKSFVVVCTRIIPSNNEVSLHAMTRLLSYFYPMTTTIESDYSGTLEITWYNGKKHLNTKNANYSYGSLQRILKFGLEKIELKKVHSVLLLGLGGGCVIETLRNDFNYKKSITAIDIDPKIIAIAKTEFNLVENDQLTIICDDALHFMQSNTTKFDLIIIDLFIDVKVPDAFLKLAFWQDVIKASSTNGSLLFNASLEKEKSNALNQVIDFLKTHFYRTEIHENVNGTNMVIIAHGL